MGTYTVMTFCRNRIPFADGSLCFRITWLECTRAICQTLLAENYGDELLLFSLRKLISRIRDSSFRFIPSIVLSVSS